MKKGTVDNINVQINVRESVFWRAFHLHQIESVPKLVVGGIVILTHHCARQAMNFYQSHLLRMSPDDIHVNAVSVKSLHYLDTQETQLPITENALENIIHTSHHTYKGENIYTHQRLIRQIHIRFACYSK